MKLIAQVHLRPSPEQADALHRTVLAANDAANYVSEQAWQTQTFRQYDLHHLCYGSVRKHFGVSAQVAVRLIAKVADAYKLDRQRQRHFHRLGSIAYDRRILSWQLMGQTVSIWSLAGRQRIPFQAGEQQLTLLRSLAGEADLLLRDGEWYLYQTCEVEVPPIGAVSDFLGIDLGIVNIATTSDGEVFSGGQVNGLRRRYYRIRRRLQRKRTDAAKKLLRHRHRKEQRFAKHTNHVIAKQLVACAERTGRGIALEELKGIRDRVRARKAHRRQLHSWAFHDLARKISYKAARVGIPVLFVDPRNTSRTCPACGVIDEANRRRQDRFSCVGCGFSGHADTIAAGNIARRAAVNRPRLGL